MRWLLRAAIVVVGILTIGALSGGEGEAGAMRRTVAASGAYAHAQVDRALDAASGVLMEARNRVTLGY